MFKKNKKTDNRTLKEDRFKKIASRRVQELLNKLKQKYGEKFQQTIFQPNGTIRESYRILLNENTMYEQDLIEIEFKDKDIIAFLPPVGGGC